ncbi:hypothetical protein HPSH465_1031 [Glaesserella parasuis H465]|nr:hypothetical protein HPSH465_1031 [Glaesserella parasuis H465]
MASSGNLTLTAPKLVSSVNASRVGAVVGAVSSPSCPPDCGLFASCLPIAGVPTLTASDGTLGAFVGVPSVPTS